MNKMQEQVAEFHRVFRLPAPQHPTFNVKDAGFRLKLVQEELAEGYEALYEFAHGDPVPYIDLLVDLMYFILGAAVSIGIDLDPFWEAVHKANMDKAITCPQCLGDGNGFDAVFREVIDCRVCNGSGRIVKYREDGKVAKPEGWQPADLYEIYRGIIGA